MKKELYPPLKLIKRISADYPDAWNQMEFLHQSNGEKGFYSWPDWCYVPMAGAIAVVAGDAQWEKIPLKIQHKLTSDAQAIFALTLWRRSKEVYVIDPDLKDLLFEQDGELDVPNEILLQLPYPCFYVEIPNTYLFGDKIIGFFVALEYDINNGDRELKPVFVAEDESVFSFSIHIDCKTISESVDLLNKEGLENCSTKEVKDLMLRSMQHSDEVKQFLKQILQVILYILAQNADITPNPEQATITRRGKTIKDKYSEIRKWDVGVRVGAAIRQQKEQQEKPKQTREGGTHQSPRPHMRRGHWHHYWTGPRSNPNEQKLILKWLSPMAIAANSDDTPIVFHEVK